MQKYLEGFFYFVLLRPPPAHKQEEAGPQLRTLAVRCSFNMAAGPISERNQGNCNIVIPVSAFCFGRF